MALIQDIGKNGLLIEFNQVASIRRVDTTWRSIVTGSRIPRAKSNTGNLGVIRGEGRPISMASNAVDEIVYFMERVK